MPASTQNAHGELALYRYHGPLRNEVGFYRSPVWTDAQRNFLKEEIIEDGDWAGVIDGLNGRLR